MQLQPEGILNGVTPWSPNQQGMNPNQPPPNQPPLNQQGGDPRVEAARSMAGKDADLDPESKHKIEMRRIKTLLDAADRELQMAVEVPPPGKNPQIAPRTEEEVRGRLQGGGAELLSQLMPGLEQQMRPRPGIGGLPQGGPPTGGPPTGQGGLGQLLAGLGGGRGGPPTGRPPTGGPPTGRRGEPPVGGLPQLPSNLRPQMAAQGGIVGYAEGGEPSLLNTAIAQYIAQYRMYKESLASALTPEAKAMVERNWRGEAATYDPNVRAAAHQQMAAQQDTTPQQQNTGGPIKKYQSVGEVVGEMSATGIDPMTEEELELKRQMTELSGSARDRAMETDEDMDARVQAERIEAATYLDMTEDEINARQSIIDAERLYQPAETTHARAQQAYHEDIASDEEARLREREMLYGILTTPGGVTKMAQRSAQVRPRFREDRRQADLNVAGSVRDVAGAVRDETVVPAKLDVALASDIRSIQAEIYGKGAEARDTYYASRNQALQSASQLIIGATGREQGERFTAFDAKMRQLDAQLTHEIHLAEMGQADIANMQSIFNILMQSDTDIERTYMEIAADLGGTAETRAAALEWKQLMIERISLQKQEVWNAMNAMKSGGYNQDATSQLQQILNQRTNPPPPPA